MSSFTNTVPASSVISSSGLVSSLLYLAQARLAAARLEYTQVAERHGWISANGASS
jgi:hypothetical protein